MSQLGGRSLKLRQPHFGHCQPPPIAYLQGYMTGRRILFADDDPGIQRALKRLAEKNGFELVPVFAGSDVYQTAVVEAPDLIVLDIHFPDADGRDPQFRLRSGDYRR